VRGSPKHGLREDGIRRQYDGNDITSLESAPKGQRVIRMVKGNVRRITVHVVALSRTPIFLVDLWDALEGAEDIHVDTYATEPNEVFTAVRRCAVHLAILDLRLPWTMLCLVASSLARQSVPTLVLGDSISAARGLDLLRTGAAAMLDRRSPGEALVRSIRAIAGGDVQASRALQQSMLRLVRASELRSPGQLAPGASEPGREGNGAATRAAAGLPEDSLLHLTGRERTVAHAALEGRTNQEIADTLGISDRTVKHHLTSIFRKSGVRNRTELVSVVLHGI
jgi:DNA-binding NarL/FixJ family response regulator